MNVSKLATPLPGRNGNLPEPDKYAGGLDISRGVSEMGPFPTTGVDLIGQTQSTQTGFQIKMREFVRRGRQVELA